MSPAPVNSFTPLPFGLRDLKVYPLTGETYTTPGIDLPNNQKLTFAEAEQFVELRGDDALIAVHGKGPQVDWDVTAGGVSLDVVKVIYGGTIVETGVWANGTGTGVRKLTKRGTDNRPYFRLEGQAYSDSGGDFHCVIYRCKANSNLTGALDENAFWITGMKGIGLPRASDSALWDFVQNEQPAFITPGVMPTIVNQSPPTSNVRPAAYGPYTFTATGDAPIVWSVVSGALPVGLTLNSATGVLSGTITNAGSSTFTVAATNASGQANTNPITITAT